MKISGFADERGTIEYVHRIGPRVCPENYRQFDNIKISSIGLGTYLGELTPEIDQMAAEAAASCLEQGIQLIDTALNYRAQRSERIIGQVLKERIEKGPLKRNEVFLSTKGGFIPYNQDYPEDHDLYVEEEFYNTGLLNPRDVVDRCHSLNPFFIEHSLHQSLNNLNLETIDLYYIHNPEMQLETVTREAFMRRLKEVFGMLEKKVQEGKIRAYGIATWDGLRVPKEHKNYLNLFDIHALAEEVGGKEHHFKAIQLPYNQALVECVSLQNQDYQKEKVCALQAAAICGLKVFSSASLLQGQLAHLGGHNGHHERYFPGCVTAAQQALQFARSTPGILSILVGMKQRQHFFENIALMQLPPVDIAAHYKKNK